MCDGELSLVQLTDDVKRLRTQPAFIQHSLAYGPQSNGATEHVVRECVERLRRSWMGVERKLGGKVESDWPEVSCGP